MRFKTWLKAIWAPVGADSAELFSHHLRTFLVIFLDLLMLQLLHLSFVPSHVAQLLEPLLSATLMLAVAIFCIQAVATLSLNSYFLVRKRLNDNISRALSLCAIASILSSVYFTQSFVSETAPNKNAFQNQPLRLDLNVTRGLGPANFLVPAKVRRVELSFVIRNCQGCRYFGLLDNQEVKEIYSYDNWNNFLYKCNSTDLHPGWHKLRILEYNPAHRSTKNPLNLEFEVRQ
jgi:hypothetical protein